VGVYAQSDASGSSPLGTFNVSSIIGEWVNVTLNMENGTDAIWFGEGTGSGIDPKEDFDYIFAEVDSGASLDYNVRNCSLGDCSDGIFVSYVEGLNLTGRYFQYQVDFDTLENTPVLSSVNVNYGVDNPVISISSPGQGETFDYGDVGLNFSIVNYSALDSCWYDLNGAGNTFVSCADLVLSLGNGNYDILLYVNDSFGNLGSDSVSFEVDIDGSTPPAPGPSTSSGGGGGGSVVVNTGVKFSLSLNVDSVKSGENTGITIGVTNTGTKFLNSCSVSVEGEMEIWFSNVYNWI